MLRADFPALFFVGGGAMIWGAWKRNGDLLLVPAAIFGIALFGRLVSVFADGTAPGFWFPMMVEAAAVVFRSHDILGTELHAFVVGEGVIAYRDR